MGKRIDFDALRAEVQASHDEFRAAGVYPSGDRIAKAIRRSKSAVEAVRKELIADGLLEFDESMGWQNMIGPSDDPEAVQPDDPDAAEIQARIAAARSTKRDRRRPMTVTHSCGLMSSSRPRSRQAASF